MERLGSRSSNIRRSLTDNVLIPEGLLQSVNSGIYGYSRRHVENDARETQTLSQVIEQPTQAVLAINHLTRSRTPDYGPSGHAQIGLGRTPTSASQRFSRHFSLREQRHLRRVGSGDAATLRRGQREASHRTPSPLLIDTGWSRPGDALPAGQLTRTTRFTEATSPSRELFETEPQLPQRPSGTSSPTPRIGRISIHKPPETHDNLRHVSFTPGRDSITVRRPTVGSQTHRASILRKASTAIGNTLSEAISRTRQTSIRNTYENAKLRQKRLQRSKPFQILFQYAIYLLLLTFVYFVLVGRPLWGGTVWYIYVLFEYHLAFVGGSAIFIGLAFL